MIIDVYFIKSNLAGCSNKELPPIKSCDYFITLSWEVMC